MSDLSLSNVITISVSEAQTGVGAFNTSNIAIFSIETPVSGFGSLGYNIYLEPSLVGQHFGTNSITYKMANAVFSQQPNILAGGGSLIIIPLQSSGTEELSDAITRTEGLVQYCGVITTQILSQSDMLAAAAVIQPLNKIAAFVSRTATDVNPGGMLDLLRTEGYTQSRGLFYGGATDLSALLFMAAYMSKGMSVDFTGSNTTNTLHLKDLVGVTADPSMTQTLLASCVAAGVDTYVSLQGVAKIFCSGLNSFFDSVYNLMYFVGALEVAGFNYLAQSATKIPQTEAGMDGLKGAYRAVCEQSVNNAYAAPGVWTSATTFGNQEDFLANISQAGYYIYSAPISQQLPTDRLARKSPLVQVALKEAGALHSASIIVNINP